VSLVFLVSMVSMETVEIAVKLESPDLLPQLERILVPFSLLNAPAKLPQARLDLPATTDPKDPSEMLALLATPEIVEMAAQLDPRDLPAPTVLLETLVNPEPLETSTPLVLLQLVLPDSPDALDPSDLVAHPAVLETTVYLVAPVLPETKDHPAQLDATATLALPVLLAALALLEAATTAHQPVWLLDIKTEITTTRSFDIGPVQLCTVFCSTIFVYNSLLL